MTREQQMQLRKQVAPFEKSDVQSSVWQLINSIVPFLAIWVLAYLAFDRYPLVSFALAAVNAGFVVRIFIIFHDCTHGSFFKDKKWNDRIGNLTGVLTLFPYEKWKREHAIHHATSGNLDKRGTGDIWVMTVDEYAAASKMQRFIYRAYRHPFVMFILGPLYLVLYTNRVNRKDARKKERLNTYGHTIAFFILCAGLIWLIGWQAFLVIHGTTMFVAAALGIWLFYIQHTFEDSYFENESDWDYVKAAVDGSSYYKLPKVLQWATGNIGFHHVHHLSPRVPNYRLEAAHNSTPPLQTVTTITIKQSLESLKFRLYDQKRRTFVGFQEAQRIIALMAKPQAELK